MKHLTSLIVRSLVPAAVSFCFALPACSSAAPGADESTADQSADELSTVCGGIAGLSCPAGKRCVLSGNYPDASGHCYRECGGLAGLTCPSSYHCELDGDYPDAMGVCKRGAPSNLTCASVDCARGYHCEEKGLNGGSPVPVCIQDADDAGPDLTCATVDCAPNYHCEEKGLNGGAPVPVCIAN